MGSIITFYSYKGGVGRSMALVNVAIELSKKGKKVLIVDWDLEAPGIEKYFEGYWTKIESHGLIHLLYEWIKNKNYSITNFTFHLEDLSRGINIDIVPSGKSYLFENYTALIQSFNWSDFFEKHEGGRLLEDLRKDWKHRYDFVLIDSRTGLSDSSGVCTILMPDILIPMFTPNYQSIFGVKETIDNIKIARQKLDVERMNLTVFPIATRFGTRAEFKESQEWIDRMAELLKDIYSDWVPKWITAKDMIENSKIPQIDYFGYGEKIAVLEEGYTDPDGLAVIYTKITDLILSNFSDIEKFIGSGTYINKKKLFDNAKINAHKTAEKYDVFISYPQEYFEWVRSNFIPALKEYLSEKLGREAKMFIDIEIPIGINWENHLNKTILDSKSIILIINNKITTEFPNLLKRNEDLIIINLEKMNINTHIWSNIYKWNNFSKYYNIDMQKNYRLRTEFGNDLEKLAEDISLKINNS